MILNECDNVSLLFQTWVIQKEQGQKGNQTPIWVTSLQVSTIKVTRAGEIVVY